MSEFFGWLFTTDHLQDFSILTLCFCIVMSGRAIDRHNRQISMARRKVNYHFREWIFARQRYWGEPVPCVYTDDGKTYFQKHGISKS